MIKVFDNKKQLITYITIISIILIFVVAGVFFLDKKFFSKEPSEVEISERDKMLTEMGVPEKEIYKMTDEEKDKIIDSKYYEYTSPDYIYSKKNKEYDDTEGLKKILVGYLESFNFSDIVNRVDSLGKKYNFTTKANQEIISIYNDAKMLTNVYRLNDIGYSNVLMNVTSPLVFTTVYLSSPSQLVKDVTLLDSAKYPLFEGMLSIDYLGELSGESLENDEYYSLIEDYAKGPVNIYKIKVEGSTITETRASVTCYASKTTSNKSQLQMLGCFENGFENKLLYVHELSN